MKKVKNPGKLKERLSKLKKNVGIPKAQYDDIRTGIFRRIWYDDMEVKQFLKSLLQEMPTIKRQGKNKR